MFSMKIVFLILLTGMNGEIVPFGEVTAPKTLFPTFEACKAAGESIIVEAGPALAQLLKESQLGIPYGANLTCTPLETI